MALVTASLLALALSAAPKKPERPVEPAKRVEGSKLEQGQRAFTQGDFDAALKSLDAAAIETSEPATLEKVHLLRAQCFAARNEFARAEEAFALALDANPEASLDPARVDPTVVKLLEAVRARLTGTLEVASTPLGATIRLDGHDAGPTPNSFSLPVGRHTLGVRWPDGTNQATDVQVRPRREVRIEYVQAAPVTVTSTGAPAPRPVRPFGDFRGSLEPATTGALSGWLDLGGGIELNYFRIGLWARLFERFGVVPRFQFALPVFTSGSYELAVLLELGVPITFLPQGVGVGLHGAGGAEFYVLNWFGFFVTIGGRHHFLWPGRNDTTSFTATAGVRLRVP